jgi:AraC-like DNA-binding protein
MLSTEGTRVLNESDTLLSDGAGARPRPPVASTFLTYREWQAPPELRHVLECFWRRERWRPPSHGLGVLPDGRVDLIWAAGEAIVIGPQTRSLKRPLPPDVAVIGARFAPGVGPGLLGVPAHELANMHVPLEAIDAGPATVLRRDLAAIQDCAVASQSIARAIGRRLDSHRPRDLAVKHATALLSDPRARVEHVACALGLSERQLQRRFRQEVGYGPKALQRVLRFQRLLRVLKLEYEPGGLARIAAAVGYSDQAHLTREAREFSGLSPSRLKIALRALAEAGAAGIFKTGGPGPAVPRRAPARSASASSPATEAASSRSSRLIGQAAGSPRR